ncbi:sigma-54 interaction domain-containing protein [Hylemonella sp. W303a]|uniref:sigma-54 interaction domain-containing protein n=1 Tax=Hylemonella sp. W303a TaxID=3389873 RepID=UPI00396B123C
MRWLEPNRGGATAMSALFQYQLLGSSPAFRKVRLQIERIAGIDATVLIEGETGTGKEMAARAIHYLGQRKDCPFVPINCGALTEHLIESELFGHERGAFTDAKTMSGGLIQAAHGGTLFLDEIDSLGHKAQAALLRFLQDGMYRRVGSGKIQQANVRVLVASNANLLQLAEDKKFRKDLYFRISVLSLRMPSLRERTGDAVELAEIFVSRFARHYGRDKAKLAPESVAYINSHEWPGNVRELENAVHRAFLLSDSPRIVLPDVAETAEADSPRAVQGFRAAKVEAVRQFERSYVLQIMNETGGNITKAARLANQDPSAFGKLVRKYRSDLQA